MRIAAFAGVLSILFIFVFVFMKAAPVRAGSGPGLLTEADFDGRLSEAFNATADAPILSFGMLGLIVGTLLSTLLALIAAGVLSIGAAITIAGFAPRPVASVLLSVVRLMASVPSVIFGLIGAMIVVPFIESAFIMVDMQIEFLDRFQMTGRNLLSTVIVLTFMIAPTVISLSADALRSVPGIYGETGFAFGMDRFRVMWKILLPAARPGIVAGFILGAGRGIGEAIAVSMVCGGIGMIPLASNGVAALLTPVLPLAAAIINKSEAMSVPAVESALFTCGALLLIMGTLFSGTARFFVKRFSSGGNIHEV
jgi:phosphate transport system permease protein